MNIWLVSFYIPGVGFGILAKGFLSKEEAEVFAQENQDDVPTAQLTVDCVEVEVTVQ